MNKTMKTENLKTLRRTEWFVLIGLMILSAIPVLGGAFRMTQLVTGAEITASNARFFASPIPIALHLISVILYSILGAFQFIPTMRRRYPKWHRRMGWVLLPSGLIVALTGLWMSQFYPLPDTDGFILYVFRLIVGSLMILELCLAYIAIRQRKFEQHGRWMIRAYAIGVGAGTQVVTYIPYFILFGEANTFQRAMLMGASWLINIIIAEWVIQKRFARPRRRATIAIST